MIVNVTTTQTLTPMIQGSSGLDDVGSKVTCCIYFTRIFEKFAASCSSLAVYIAVLTRMCTSGLIM